MNDRNIKKEEIHEHFFVSLIYLILFLFFFLFFMKKNFDIGNVDIEIKS